MVEDIMSSDISFDSIFSLLYFREINLNSKTSFFGCNFRSNQKWFSSGFTTFQNRAILKSSVCWENGHNSALEPHFSKRSVAR